MNQKTQTFLVTITLEKEVSSLAEKIGHRAYTINGVVNTAVQPVSLGTAGQVILPTGDAV